MALSGQLLEFSLPELFQVLDRGKKSGTLTLRVFQESNRTFEKNYIFFDKGLVIGFANSLSGQDLFFLLQNEKLITQKVFATLIRQVDEFKIKTTAGQFLQDHKLLSSDQMRTVFNIQVVQPIYRLLEIENAWYTFNDSLKPSPSELTGLSVNSLKLSFAGLKLTKNWSRFSDKFPDASAGLIVGDYDPGTIKLNEVEEKVMSLSTGSISLAQISRQIKLSLEEVQKIAFCFIAIGIALEMPIFESSPANEFVAPVPDSRPENPDAPTVNRNFLSNLKSFLKNRIALEPAR